MSAAELFGEALNLDHVAEVWDWSHCGDWEDVRVRTVRTALGLVQSADHGAAAMRAARTPGWYFLTDHEGRLVLKHCVGDASRTTEEAPHVVDQGE